MLYVAIKPGKDPEAMIRHQADYFGSCIYDLKAHSVVGPLTQMFDSDVSIYYEGSQTRVLFLGDTCSGKTQAIRSIANALGGFVVETTNKNGRTKDDYNLVFAYSPMQDELVGLELDSNSGHDLKHTLQLLGDARGRDGFRFMHENHILVCDGSRNLKADIPRFQSYINAILGYKSYVASDVSDLKMGLLLTRGVTHSRDEVNYLIDSLEGLVANGVYDVDNISRTPSLDEIPPNNLRILLTQVRRKCLSSVGGHKVLDKVKLVNFGDQKIPSHLDDMVVRFSDLPFSFVEMDEFFEKMHMTYTICHPAFNRFSKFCNK